MNNFWIVLIALLAFSCKSKDLSNSREYHLDKPFIQDYSVKYVAAETNVKLYNVESDRNGYIQILSSKGLLRPDHGQFLYPGYLVNDKHYKPTSGKRISGIGKYHNQIFALGVLLLPALVKSAHNLSISGNNYTVVCNETFYNRI